MEIDPNDVIANLLNKIAGLTLDVAKLEVVVQKMQTKDDNDND